MSRHLARDLLLVAEDLDGKGYLLVGVIRRAARLLAELELEDRPDDGCQGCGGRLDHPATGRRRVWCSERCRRRKRP